MMSLVVFASHSPLAALLVCGQNSSIFSILFSIFVLFVSSLLLVGSVYRILNNNLSSNVDEISIEHEH